MRREFAKKSIKFVKKYSSNSLFSEDREWNFGEINDLANINHGFKPMET